MADPTYENSDQPATEVSVREQRRIRRESARIETIRQRRNQDDIIAEFQPDAVEIETRSIPGGARWTLYTVFALVASAIAWACWAEVDKIVTAQGKLITVDPPVVIDTQVAAAIRTMNVEFGDRVKAGQLLATLDPTYPEADLKQLHGRIAALEANIARLKAEQTESDFDPPIAATDKNYAMERSVFLRRRTEYEAKIREFEANKKKYAVLSKNNEADISSEFDKLDLYSGFLKTTRKLVKSGSKSELDLLGAVLQVGGAEKDYNTALGKREQYASEIDALDAQRDAYMATWSSDAVQMLAEATQSRKDAEQELAKLIHTNSQVELRVPNNLPQKEFFVLEVADVSVGSVSEPGQPVFRLVPLDVPFEVEADIPAKDVQLIQEGTAEQFAARELPKGSQVRIKVSAFPFQRHGTLDGVVRRISEGSFEKGEQAAILNPEAATTYKTRIQIIDPNALKDVSNHFRLMPGMTATAEIKVGKRRVIQYFLYPLLRYMDESFREN